MYDSRNKAMQIEEEGHKKRLTTQQGAFMKHRLLDTLNEGPNMMSTSVRSRPESGSDQGNSTGAPASDHTCFLTQAEQARQAKFA